MLILCAEIDVKDQNGTSEESQECSMEVHGRSEVLCDPGLSQTTSNHGAVASPGLRIHSLIR